MNSNEVIQKLLDYLVWLQTPNESFGGVPICPFIKGDFESDRIKFSVYSQRHEKSLTEHITEYVESGKSTGIIVQLDPVRTTRKRYQRFVNKLMKENGFGDYKSLVLDPLEEWSLAGVETRKMAPCVLINIGTRKDFGKAAKYMTKTSTTCFSHILTQQKPRAQHCRGFWSSPRYQVRCAGMI